MITRRGFLSGLIAVSVVRVAPDLTPYIAPVAGGTFEDSGFHAVPWVYGFDAELAPNRAAFVNVGFGNRFRWMFTTAKSNGAFMFRMLHAQDAAKPLYRPTFKGAGTLLGTAMDPLPLPMAYEFPGDSRLLVVFKNETDKVNHVRMDLIGANLDLEAAISQEIRSSSLTTGGGF